MPLPNYPRYRIVSRLLCFSFHYFYGSHESAVSFCSARVRTTVQCSNFARLIVYNQPKMGIIHY